MKLIHAFLGTILLACSSITFAGIIQNSGQSASFDTLIDFESVTLSTNEVVTTQFSPEGLTIVSFAGDVWANSCGVNISGTGNYINTYGLNCSTNNIFQDFSLVFDNDISSLTWLVGYTGGGINYSTYLNGVVVEALNNVALARRSYTTFTGLFDEIRITEVGNGSYTMVDELQITYAEVPEPSTLAIFALGIMGLALRRFKKQS